MTQKNKELLLKDLCARLPYRVKVGTTDNDGSLENVWDILWYNTFTEDIKITHSIEDVEKVLDISEVRPYLIPISSMTDEQEAEYNDLNNCELGWFPYTEDAFDYLVANHFDYNGLIPMDLANDATGLNIY